MITYTTKSGRTFSFEKVQLRTDELPALIVFITSDWVENQNRFIVIQDPDTLAWAPALSGEVTEEIELKALLVYGFSVWFRGALSQFSECGDFRTFGDRNFKDLKVPFLLCQEVRIQPLN